MKKIIILSLTLFTLILVGSCNKQRTDEPGGPHSERTPDDANPPDDADPPNDTPPEEDAPNDPSGAQEPPPPEYRYKVACKCKNLKNLSMKTKSTISSDHAKLVAGAVCSALQSEKAIVIKKEADKTKEDMEKINSITAKAIKEALSGSVDKAVLDFVYDCKPLEI